MKTLRCMCMVCVVFVMASCGFPRPPDVGDDGTGDTNCQLTALAPTIANTGDTITLEGTFANTVTVNFPGGGSAAATVLGTHRARVIVPSSATEGDLTVSTCGSSIGPLRFRRASFPVGVGAFASSYEQAAGARQFSSLANARDSHAGVVVNRYLYVLGGVARSGSLNSVERALINADGSLGRFMIMPDVTLVAPRQAYTATVLGDQLYVIGGFSNGALSSIEHATIAADGSIGPFTTLSNVSLTTARQGHTSAVIGNYLYVLGGFGTSPLNNVERAVIHGDGSLGQFASVPDVTLATARHGHTAAVIGNYLYVVGGASNGGALQDVERASINADGSLGPFALASGTSLVNARSGHAAVMLGSDLYVFGGVGGSGTLSTAERAPIDGDGSLGPFEAVPHVRSGRHGHTITVAGNYLYTLGGSDDVGLIDHAERASLDAGGSLGDFAVVPGVALTTERGRSAGAVLGNYFYMLGGGLGPTSVERATINADGSLGLFSPVMGVTLAHPRDGLTSAVIGPYFYVLGGGDNSVERSTISGDGSLGAFETVSSTLMTSRIGATSAIVGDYLYVLGGSTGSDAVATSIERASIDPDNSLGPFETFTGSAEIARDFHMTQVIGNYLYVIGGSDAVSGSFVATVARAPLNVNGALGPFETVTGISLNIQDPNTTMVGNYVYAFGINSVVERSNLTAADSPELGSFMVVPGVTLTSRFAEAIAVIGNYVYAVGGVSGRVFLNSIARAELK